MPAGHVSGGLAQFIEGVQQRQDAALTVGGDVESDGVGAPAKLRRRRG
jgi:hypothetical protein